MPDRELASGTLWIAGDRIDSIADSARADAGPEAAFGENYDFAGDTLIPGLIDLHVHGCGGSDVMDGSVAALTRMAEELLRRGTTAFLPTTMTAPFERLETLTRIVAEMPASRTRAEILGLHWEGPWIAPDYHGAQQVLPAPAAPERLAIRVKILTLAPELPQARQWIQKVHDTGIILSAGHSGATYEEMLPAIDAGVRRITHAFNAMPGIHHRKPGLLTAALLDDRVDIELIADGVHIHPAVLELALRLKGVDKVTLISDGTRATGMPAGEYELGGQRVRLDHGRMTLPDGTIAGSAATLFDGVKFMADKVGRPLYEAVRMAAFNPAQTLGVADRLGSLLPGREATFLRLAQDLAIKEVWLRGCRIH